MAALSPEQLPLRANSQPYPAQIPHGSWPSGTERIAIPSTKAYVCPLSSCGWMFKRMEHLKHVRTHTLDRPYQCQYCKTRFSRSDKLNQHLRTHLRSSDGTAAGENDAYAQSEEVDELKADGEGYLNGLGSIPDVQMCEVEVQGQIQEVQGDEEGLLMPAPSLTHSVSTSGSVDEVRGIYYSDGAGNVADASPAKQLECDSLASQSRLQHHQHAFSAHGSDCARHPHITTMVLSVFFKPANSPYLPKVCT